MFSNKKWRLQDIIREEGANQVVSVLKFSHPCRMQRVVIVPTPRYALESYYNDWVYQPYAKNHRMYVSNDIFNPTYVYLARILLRRNFFPDYAYFHPMRFPDSVDVNLPRRTFASREMPIKTPILSLLLVPVLWRDRRHTWFNRRVLKIVGDRYVSHPAEGQQSLMLIMPPAYAADAANTLQGLGFKVVDHTTAVIGEEAVLGKLSRWSDIAQLIALVYIWFMIVLFFVNESRRLQRMFTEYKRDLAIKAGRDPEELGL
ncbi:hypothetical protein ERJ75_001601200 [Trypanosoma vivax]|uniref:Uncharacterized protein n=1 Tax=Trypanosoma vivax (strain Y486) TaxID=1055687 RepID=G0TSM6_TRYVY|nr:hypothetical protein TRVL_01215 [Trypanosoma vivax]KAH8605483.1 hypothetical protein ERJ75_001601200 [Trypanosoma vivax]CCC46953.1 conserved hypothetical protein [Trypanosoma vivax Y486]